MAAINHRMDQAYDLFISSVTPLSRPDRAGKALKPPSGGDEAVKNGLADELANPQDYLNGLAAKRGQVGKPAQSDSLRARAIEMQNQL